MTTFKVSETHRRWSDTLTRLVNRVISWYPDKTKSQLMIEVHRELRKHFESYPDDPTIRVIEKKVNGFQVMVTIDKVGKIKMDFTVESNETSSRG